MPRCIMPVGIITHMQSVEFSTWLQEQLNERGWDQADLVRRSGVSQSQVSRIMTGTRNPGPETSKAIARALRLPPEDVLRQAGILPPKNASLSAGDRRFLVETMDKIATLSPDAQRLIADLVDKVWRGEQR